MASQRLRFFAATTIAAAVVDQSTHRTKTVADLSQAERDVLVEKQAEDETAAYRRKQAEGTGR